MRTRVAEDRIRSARARKRCTISKHQIALALDWRIDQVDSYSFILTNVDVGTEEKRVEVEFWYRHRNRGTEQERQDRHRIASPTFIVFSREQPLDAGFGGWGARCRLGSSKSPDPTTATGEGAAP